MAQLQEKYPDDVRFVYRHFPLPSHDKAPLATQAAEAAGLQGQFWPMHDVLFEKQAEWAGLTVAEFETWLLTEAAALDLDVEQFQVDLNSTAMQAKATDALQFAQSLGLPGTPSIAINGQYYDGPWDVGNLSAIVELFLLEEKQFTECPPLEIDPTASYTATLVTERGDIVIELYADLAPVAVNNFIFLAENDWFDGITFHRVMPGFVAQSGDPSGSGYGGPGYFFANEANSLRFDQAGMVGMANSGVDTNGSQFFITFAPLPDLDGGYTIFGKVIEGLDVAESLTARNPAQGGDLPPGDVIEDVIITGP